MITKEMQNLFVIRDFSTVKYTELVWRRQ